MNLQLYTALNQYGCMPGNNFTIAVHGWMESAQNQWVQPMLANFSKYRRGCVMFMQYGHGPTYESYFSVLLPNFDGLANLLVQFLRRLETLGFDAGNGLLFGFSFGGQLVLEAGRRLGTQKLGRIDVCEPAGPGFDDNGTYSAAILKNSAKKVQCIYTGLMFSSLNRNCHVNWKMGFCGISQPASGAVLSDHNICPYFYNSAFENRFPAMAKPLYCLSTKAAISWPQNFRMGFFCDVNSGATGDFYAKTSSVFPYN
ncbi:uncharacterized protein LOC129741665 [Uranotaenia lowii]|uniref:uncharacterized protein LOC129741665 n=1 Tax=Uranotaenia lowii TaxID=190385 RepID=UPI00247A2BB0|nr:uncharacterized protein LOC129741665 [Uranotaenia lowii]